MNSVFLYLGSPTDSNGNVISTDVTGNSGTEATNQTMLDGSGLSNKNRGARASSVSLSLITVLLSMLPYHHFT